MAGGAASLIISRAGSTLFEIADWGVPSILIPFTKSNADHSRKNAFSYARAGACSVIEEANMTANILSSEIERIMEDKAGYEAMAERAKEFSKPGAAAKIARELGWYCLGAWEIKHKNILKVLYIYVIICIWKKQLKYS